MGQSGGRIAWVDYAKGIGILGVFVLHSNTPFELLHAIDMFCMPLFFLLSGFVFSIRRYTSFPLFPWNKLRTLVFPGLFFGIIRFVIRCFTGVIPYNLCPLKTHVRWFANFAINLRGQFCEIPWFLACLFVIEIGGYALLRLCEHIHSSDWLMGALALACILIGYGYSKLVHISLPWSMDIALPMFAPFILGYMLRRHYRTLERIARPWTAIPATLLLFAASLLNTPPVVVYLNQYGNIVCWLVGMTAGIWMVIALCIVFQQFLANKPLMSALTYCGRNTLVFYCVNLLIYPNLIPFILEKIGLEPSGGSLVNQLLCVMGSVVIDVIICSTASEIMNRCFPAILGKRTAK